MHEKKHRKIIIIVSAIALGMFTFTFAMAPLYNKICRATGLNGRVNLLQFTAGNPRQVPQTNRTVSIQFVTTTNANLAWDFYPQHSSVETFPEKNTKMLFFVKNNTKKTLTVQAVPSITPWQAASHLHKVECFCFQQQTLQSGAALAMPVVFRLDKDLPPDIKTITLAYTLFDVTKKGNRG